MILVDTSVWIDLFGRSPKHELPRDRLQEVATCPSVIQEVLQGIGNDLAYKRIKEGMISLPTFGAPTDVELFLHASEIYRLARRQGKTIRSSVDCLIAAVALKHSLTVWHADRDFEVIAQFTGLRVLSSLRL